VSTATDPGSSAVGIAARILGDRAEVDGPLGALTTYRVGGRAAVVAHLRRLDDLRVVAEAKAVSGLPVLVVGRGSNLLVADDGFPGVAVLLEPEGFADVALDGHRLRAGAAVPLPTLARRSADAGLTGFEWTVGVPGSLGGAVRMNAGGHGSDMAASLVSCQVADLDVGGAVATRTVAELRLGYRSSAVAPHQVVVSAEVALAPGDPEKGRATIRDIVRWRREHQPGGQNAGSVFTNPRSGAGYSAGWLVEAAGLKGHRLGTAMVSPKHANFIQADPGGSADDVARLIGLVADVVAARFGVRLRPEVRTAGFPPSLDPARGSSPWSSDANDPAQPHHLVEVED
jgi:UDP-N-acetylmuramate dehydrogenase